MHILSFLIACGPKAPSTTDAVEAPPAEVVEAPPAEPEAPVAPELPPPPTPNADFSASFTYSDGSTKSGHVMRVERSSDYYGLKDWLDTSSKLTLYGQSGSNAKDFAWTDVKSITIAPTKDAPSCVYESEWTPWLYVCSMKTTSTLIDSTGAKWSVDSGYKWKFIFDDESSVEFWAQNYRALQQDDKEVDLSTDVSENMELYMQLQNNLRTMPYVKKLDITK